MTAEAVEDLLVTEVSGMKDGEENPLFDRTESMTIAEYDTGLTETEKAVAFVVFAGDKNTGHHPRLITEDVYQITVVTRKKGGDPSRTPLVLTAALRDLIHGKRFGNADLQLFEYAGRELLEHDESVIQYAVRFTVRNMLHIPDQT